MIPYHKGLLGHSDADVLTHAIMDSILGALGLGDIGKHFPDASNAYKDISSLLLLDHVYALMQDRGYAIGNLDATIIAQKPKMAPYIEAMKTTIALHLHCDVGCVNIKATTTEGLGFEGREEGISSLATVLIVPRRECNV